MLSFKEKTDHIGDAKKRSSKGRCQICVVWRVVAAENETTKSATNTDHGNDSVRVTIKRRDKRQCDGGDNQTNRIENTSHQSTRPNFVTK